MTTVVSQLFKSIAPVFCLTFTILFLGVNSTIAQSSGNISGKVIDKSSGDELPFANVYLEGTSFGAATDAEGKYILYQIPAGDYNLITAYIGYKEISMPVSVTAGGDVTLNIELDYAGVEGDVVVVTAQASGQMGAINQQLNSNTIKNVVSADKIKDVPDGNAAESVSRLPGMSLVRSGGEGQKVAVRGISPKYNVMMVNGVRMQSTDRNDRSVDLNMIAPNILSGIEVTKALTADMDADAVGGTVNLKIGKAAEGLQGNFSMQNGYGSLADTYGNYRATGFLSNRFFNNKFGVQVSGFLDNFNRNSDVLSVGYALNEEAVLEGGFIPVDLARVSISDRVTQRQRLGGSLVFDYQFKNGSIIMNNFVSNLAQQQTVQQNSLALVGNQWSAYASVGEQNNTVISNAIQGQFDFSIFSLDFSVSNSISNQNVPGDLQMNVGIAQAESGFTTPSLEDPTKATPSELLNAAVIIEGPNAKRIQRFTTLQRDVSEQAQEAMLNLNVPFSFSKTISGKLKFGGKYVRNFRDNDETLNFSQPDRNFVGEQFVVALKDSLWTDLGLDNVDRNLGIRASLFEQPDYDIGDFLSGDEGINSFFYKADIGKMQRYEELAKNNASYEEDIKGSTQYDYDYERGLFAFYTMAEVNIGKYVTLFPGIRYENFNFNYNSAFTERFGPNPVDFRNEPLSDDKIKGANWFPQLHLRVKPTDWLDIRFASTKSIIYPDYRAISPYMYYDSYSGPSLDLGNTSLQPAIAQNYDIYASIFQNKLGLITAGYFYKEIDNLIVSSTFRTKDPETINNRFDLIQTQQTTVNTWINLDATSTVSGVELDWQTNFWYLPSFLKGIVVSINYTKITSSTSYPFQTSVKQGTGPFAKTVFVDSTRTGRMPNQPDDIFNFTLGYDIGGFSARLSYVYTDNVLVEVNRTYDELDSYTAAYKRWDFTAYQKLPWLNGQLQLYLNVNNITNTADRSFTSTLQKLSSLEYYGRTMDLGLRYKFAKTKE
ncbi:TonB-dependent receptor [Portibacter lacus]|uniref:TonB-dependent receptor n=2 Tax=Portibacter lacus TaxID=1099794 RepID=A0AA37SPQ8_9BACT|nr:TonB-dependent receptor [Portibacter lacus]GLR17897.1 TonB-dependent receptor [Portibacter lacus]